MSINKTCSVRQRGIAGGGVETRLCGSSTSVGGVVVAERQRFQWAEGAMTHLHAGGWTSREHEEDAGNVDLHEDD